MSLFTPNTYKLFDKRDVRGLTKALRHKKAYVRMGAAENLGKLGDPRAVEPLIAALDEPDGQLRSYIVSALAAINEASAVDALIAALDDESRAEGAAEALGEIGDPRAAEPLIAVLADEQHRARGRRMKRAFGPTLSTFRASGFCSAPRTRCPTSSRISR